MSTPPITELLKRWQSGDKVAERALLDALYPSLKRQAMGALARFGSAKLSISATELVHENYLRLINQQSDFHNRVHFYAIAARTLSWVLQDLVKAKKAQKRGAEFDHVELSLAESESSTQPATLDLMLAMERLAQLTQLDDIAAQVLELRLLGGLSNQETAEVLNISTATAVRHFAFARAWLGRTN